MRTAIRGRFVVGFQNGAHSLLRDSEVVFEDNRIIYVGPKFEGRVDYEVNAGQALIAPGFVDLDALADIDHSLFDTWVGQDVMAGLRWSAEYFRAGRHELFSAEEQGFLRRFALAQLLMNGITTAVPIAAETYRNWAETGEEFADLVHVIERLGIRAYLGPSFRSGVNVTLEDGSPDVLWRVDLGERGLNEAIEFVRTFDGSAGGRVKGILAPARIETCTLDLLRRCLAAAAELGCMVRIHAAQSPIEVELLKRWYGCSPVALLDQLGAWGRKTALVHARFTSNSELEQLAAVGASVIWCPLTNVRQGIPGHSFRRFLDLGLAVALGTDTFPPDMVKVMEHGWYLTKLIERDQAAVGADDLFRAATLGGADVLDRDDLGRLAPGALADITVFDLDEFRLGPIEDPIRSIVMNGSGAQVRHVIVDGRFVVHDRRIAGASFSELASQAQNLFDRYRESFSERDFRRRSVENLFPKSFAGSVREGRSANSD